MLLVDDQQAQARQGSEEGAPGPHHHVHLPVSDAPPDIVALPGAELGVDHRDPAWETAGETGHGLGRQGDLWHQDDGLTPPGQGLLDGPQVDLRLAAAGDAVEQKDRRLSLRSGLLEGEAAQSLPDLGLLSGQGRGEGLGVGATAQGIPVAHLLGQAHQAAPFQAAQEIQAGRSLAGQLALPERASGLGQGLESGAESVRSLQGQEPLPGQLFRQGQVHPIPLPAHQSLGLQGPDRGQIAQAAGFPQRGQGHGSPRRVQEAGQHLALPGLPPQGGEPLLHRLRGEQELHLQLPLGPDARLVRAFLQQARGQEELDRLGDRGHVVVRDPEGQLELHRREHGPGPGQARDGLGGDRGAVAQADHDALDFLAAEGDPDQVARLELVLKLGRDVVVEGLVGGRSAAQVGGGGRRAARQLPGGGLRLDRGWALQAPAEASADGHVDDDLGETGWGETGWGGGGGGAVHRVVDSGLRLAARLPLRRLIGGESRTGRAG